MTPRSVSHITCLYGDRLVDAQTSDPALAVAMAKAEMRRRGAL